MNSGGITVFTITNKFPKQVINFRNIV